MSEQLRAFRGNILHCLRDPGEGGARDAAEHFEDGLLLVADGRVVALGPAAELLPGLPASAELIDHRGRLLVPGFIDTHIHYPQLDVIASYGEQLLEWLEQYTFPQEMRFADEQHAAAVAELFLDELLRNGTTTALVFATVHPQSVDAFFEAARARRLRMLCGKVLMDRNCPAALRDTAASGAADSRALIERWHGVDRLLYAITPRFAPTSTAAQLAAAGRLAAEYPGVYLQTHLAENRAECDWVAELFPDSRSYLDVYYRHGLLRERAVFAHCLHLDDADRRCMAGQGAAMAFCPTSNLFLGSGLFDLAAARDAGLRVGLGSDVGGGDSFSPLRTASEAYKVCQLRGRKLPALRALYLATLGGAEALYLDDRLGNFAIGKEADFVVLDPAATPLLARRTGLTADIEELLFALLMLGDDRAVLETRVLGELAHRR